MPKSSPAGVAVVTRYVEAFMRFDVYATEADAYEAAVRLGAKTRVQATALALSRGEIEL